MRTAGIIAGADLGTHVASTDSTTLQQLVGPVLSKQLTPGRWRLRLYAVQGGVYSHPSDVYLKVLR